MQLDELPLSRFKTVDTRSPDEAREAIGRIFCPHFLSPTDRHPADFHAVHHCSNQHGYSVNYVSYGSAVEIDPGELSRFFLVQIPVHGGATVRCGSLLAEAQAGISASILSPTLPTRMTWHAGCEKMIVLVSREAIEAQFASMVHRETKVEFDTGVDLTGPVGRSLAHHVNLIAAAASEENYAPEAYQVLLREALTMLLLTGCNHSGSHLLNQPVASAAPSAVRRAEAYIVENLEQPLTMAEIANAAGTGLRSLQDGYKRTRGMTLSQGIQRARLERLHASLLDADGPTSVADAVLAAGFGHLGRAAALYRDHYGEAPSQTFRRRR
ncbi:MAG: AraC family transcriptional regulator [Rhizobiaceae bacterium]|nr:AraC family transcriptional regulator [Rhizobiaceae bacterium]